VRILLVENTDGRRLANKDQMGGYGIGAQYGDSVGTRILSRYKRAGRRVPLLTLGYLSAVLRQQGHRVAVYNDGDGSMPAADMVVIASSIVESAAEVAFAERARRETGARVGMVGPFASVVPEHYLGHVDFVVRGEPERWAAQLRDEDCPTGIVDSPMVDDLDSLPFPDWSPFDLRRYGYWPVLRDGPFAPILSSRGCSFRCNYCPYIVQYPEWRTRSPENVVQEVEYLTKRFGVRSMLFRDPLFTQGKHRAEQIAERLLQRGLHHGVTWACETRTDLLNEALLTLLVRAGLRGLNVGVESADLDVLKSANRRQSQPHSERMIRYAESLGVKVATFYVLGLPSDTEATIGDTIAYSRHLNTFAAQFHINTPFPGTPIYDTYRAEIFARQWSEFTSFAPVFHHPHLAPEALERLKHRAYDGYYFRLGYVGKHWRHLVPALLGWRSGPERPPRLIVEVGAGGGAPRAPQPAAQPTGGQAPVATP